MRDGPPVDASACPTPGAGGGFLDQAIGQPGEVVVSSDFVATPDGVVDGMIGLSPSGAAGFNDLAATVRLSPDGVVDARDGTGYRADTAAAYAAGQPQRIRIIANVATHTFSAYLATGDKSSVQFARGYAFQPTQAAAGWLGSLDAIVDSATGAFSLCSARNAISVGVRLAREGNYAVAPLPSGDEVVVSDGATTLHLDSGGKVIAQFAAGGQVAVDPAGNVYLARIAGSDLIVDAYTAGLAPRWTRSFPAGAGHRVLALGADAASVVTAAGPGGGGVDLVKRWLADGTESTTHAGPMGDAIAVASSGFAIGGAANGTVVVSKWSFGQDVPDWQRSWQNGAHVDAIALAGNGAVRFAGAFDGPVSFGGAAIDPSQGGVYVAALSAAGDPVFSRALAEAAVQSLASNGTVTAISAIHAAHTRALVTLDSEGLVMIGENGDTGFTTAGDAGAVTVGPSGRVYWNFTEAWPTPTATAYPYLISMIPGV